MELEIITEKESSPFRHVFPSKGTNGRRYGRSPESMRMVMGEFLEKLNLQRNIRTLEIGAGHGQEPSNALVELGATATTLDADWNSFCTLFPTINEYSKLGIEQLYPILAGGNKTRHYLGDVAMIGDEKSQLREGKFDLLFYWGSVWGVDHCSSISRSATANYDFNIRIPLSERLTAPIGNVDNTMAHVAGFFNMTGEPSVHPKNIIIFNGYMVDNLLLWTNQSKRVPKKAIVFGLSPDFAFEYLRGAGIRECFQKPSEEEIRRAVDNNTIEEVLNNHWSKFTDYGSNKNYRSALKVFSEEQQREISNLGIIDCVAVQYD